jgi:hypothetical protein
MHLIVDGYNLIRQSGPLRHFEKISLEAGRRELIRRLSLYRKTRGHRITVVFDGWETGSSHEERDREGGIEILYSRRGEKADEVIKRMAGKSQDQTIVVTSDREIAFFVKQYGVATIPVSSFEAKLFTAASPELHPDREERTDSEERTHAGTKKKGPSKRLSRREKTALARFKKL